MRFVKSIEHLHHRKKNLCVCMYKMVNISKETYENNNIEGIVDGIGELWLNEKHIEGKLGQKIHQSSQTNMTKCIKSANINH